MKKIVNLTKEELLTFFDKYDSLRKIFIELGINSNGSGAYRTFRSHCKTLGVVIPSFKRNFNYEKNNKKYSLEEILIENSLYKNNESLKKRLLKEGLLEYKCNKCNISEWNGFYISLHLEHKNGTHNDNRLENLELLCPNCHSQTKTYAGKNIKTERVKLDIDIIMNSNIDFSKKSWVYNTTILTGLSMEYVRGFVKRNAPDFYKKKCFLRENIRKVEDRPTKEELQEMLNKMSFCAVGRKYGVSDNAIRKWAKSYKII